MSGTETNRELNIGLAYRGLSVGYGTSTKTFTSNETVDERETTTVYTIPAQSSLYVYQRRYHFRDDIWWIADAWNDLWNVCAPPSGFNLLRVSNESYIDAEERIAIDTPITGTQTVSVSRHQPVDQPFRQINRQFPNHTSRTRNAVTRVINDAARRSTVHRTVADIEADIEAVGHHSGHCDVLLTCPLLVARNLRETWRIRTTLIKTSIEWSMNQSTSFQFCFRGPDMIYDLACLRRHEMFFATM